jgi:hypothetical protein
MKKVIMLVVAGMFSLSAAAHACDGMKNAAKAQKAGTVAKKDGAKGAKAAPKGEQQPKKS